MKLASTNYGPFSFVVLSTGGHTGRARLSGRSHPVRSQALSGGGATYSNNYRSWWRPSPSTRTL